MTTLADTVVAATAALNTNAQAYFDKEERVALREAAVVLAAGNATNDNDSTELARAVARGLFVGSFGAAANALSCQIPGGLVLPTLEPWTRLRGMAAQTNTSGVVTLTVAGIGTAAGFRTGPLLRQDGSALQQGDVPVGVPFDVQPDAGNPMAFRMAGKVASDAGSPFGTAAGTNAYTVTLAPAPASLRQGLQILVYFPGANTITNPTLNINGLGAYPIVKQLGGALQVGDVTGFVPLIFDATLAAWRFNGLAPSAAGRIIGIRTYTASDVYVPSPGMTQIDVYGVGGGGGGAGASNPSAGLVSLGSPGGCGTNGRASFSAVQVGPSQPVNIGAGGASAASSAGANGGSTSLGSLVVFAGGLGGGIFNGATPPAYNGNGALAAAATGANMFFQRGYTSDRALAINATASGMFCGQGGNGPYGNSQGSAANTNGANATGYGAGGGGCAIAPGGGPAVGGAGAPGLLFIIEYGA